MLLEPAPPVRTTADTAPADKGKMGAPAHCKEPMNLTAGPAGPRELDGGALEWVCRCGFRLDAGMLPIPVAASASFGLEAAR